MPTGHKTPTQLLKPILYADDSNFFYSFRENENPTGILNAEINKIMDWLNANKLSLNVKKSHYIVFHPKQKKIDHQLILQINNQTIEQVQATKFLGYIIDEEITWKKHIQYLSNKLSKSIGILKKARKPLYTSTLIRLTILQGLPYGENATNPLLILWKLYKKKQFD